MSELPTPISDQDKLLSNIAIGTPDIEDLIPNSRQEVYLKYIALNGIHELPVSISQGGTGATTEADARLNLGIGNLNSLNTSTKENIVFAMNEINRTILSDHSLYFNASGTNGTITLSDNAVNYDYIEIYYFCDVGQLLCAKVYNPNGKAAILTSTTYYGDTIYFRSALLDINGKTITWRSSHSGSGTAKTSGCSVSSEQVLLVNKIVGYK